MGGAAGARAVGAAATGLGLFLVIGAQGIEGDSPYAGVGPRAFPAMVGALLAVAGATYLVAAGRGAVPAATPPRRRAPLAWIAGGLAAATVLLAWLGFALSAALLFTLTARGFGSARPVRDALLGLALGAAVYLVFARGLGVSLPGLPLPGS